MPPLRPGLHGADKFVHLLMLYFSVSTLVCVVTCGQALACRGECQKRFVHGGCSAPIPNMRSRIDSWKRSVDSNMRLFRVRMSFSLANEIGSEPRTRSVSNYATPYNHCSMIAAEAVDSSLTYRHPQKRQKPPNYALVLNEIQTRSLIKVQLLQEAVFARHTPMSLAIVSAKKIRNRTLKWRK